MSDTPRTDAHRNRHNLTDVDEHGVAYWFSFARRLERELTEARALIAKLQEERKLSYKELRDKYGKRQG